MTPNRKIIDGVEYIKVTPDSRGGKYLPLEEVREYFSENARQSFAAEGIKIKKDKWDRIQKRLREERNKNNESNT